MLYVIGTKYKRFTAFTEVENHEERCKLKQSTVSSTGYKWDVPQTFIQNPRPRRSQFRQVAPLISVWQESGNLQCLRDLIKSEQSRYKMIGLKTCLRVKLHNDQLRVQTAFMCGRG